jgi:hypothetical protein
VKAPEFLYVLNNGRGVVVVRDVKLVAGQRYARVEYRFLTATGAYRGTHMDAEHFPDLQPQCDAGRALLAELLLAVADG